MTFPNIKFTLPGIKFHNNQLRQHFNRVHFKVSENMNVSTSVSIKGLLQKRFNITNMFYIYLPLYQVPINLFRVRFTSIAFHGIFTSAAKGQTDL